LHGLQSRKAVSIIKEHQVTVLIFSGRDFSLGYAERAKLEFFLIHATQNTACAERGRGEASHGRAGETTPFAVVAGGAAQGCGHPPEVWHCTRFILSLHDLKKV
jgi:hypothetical protein